MSDITLRGQVPGFDMPTLVRPVAEDSVKAINFQLADLDITTEMSEMPAFYAAALESLASADGVIELVWRLSDFGMHSLVRKGAADGADQTTHHSSTGIANTSSAGSYGVGGWASLFQFCVKDVSDAFDASSGRYNIGRRIPVLGRCNQKRVNDCSGTTSSGIFNDSISSSDGKVVSGTADVSSDCSQNGFWPVELNVMRGIVTNDNGLVFDNMPAITNNTSAAEHYLNFVGSEITGARSGAQLFDNLPEMFNHLISEDVSGNSADTDYDISGVQYKIWKTIHDKLCTTNEADASTNNIATKLVRYMLDESTADNSASLQKLRNRFFGGIDASGSDGSSTDVTFKRFGPSGGDCSGTMVGVDFHSDNNVWVDVPLSHGDVLEFNLTLTGASNNNNGTADGNTGATAGDDFGTQTTGASDTNRPVSTDAANNPALNDGATARGPDDGADAINTADSGEAAPGSEVGASVVQGHTGTVGALADPADDSTRRNPNAGGTGVDRFGNNLPGANAIRTVTYRIRVHLEGADTRNSS